MTDTTNLERELREAAEAARSVGFWMREVSSEDVLAILNRLAEVTRERDGAIRERDCLEMTNTALGNELEALADVSALADERDKAIAERDALAGLLREAGDWLKRFAPINDAALLAKIEAALTKGNADV